MGTDCASFCRILAEELRTAPPQEAVKSTSASFFVNCPSADVKLAMSSWYRRCL